MTYKHDEVHIQDLDETIMSNSCFFTTLIEKLSVKTQQRSKNLSRSIWNTRYNVLYSPGLKLVQNSPEKLGTKSRAVKCLLTRILIIPRLLHS